MNNELIIPKEILKLALPIKDNDHYMLILISLRLNNKLNEKSIAAYFKHYKSDLLIRKLENFKITFIKDNTEIGRDKYYWYSEYNTLQCLKVFLDDYSEYNYDLPISKIIYYYHKYLGISFKNIIYYVYKKIFIKLTKAALNNNFYLYGTHYMSEIRVPLKHFNFPNDEDMEAIYYNEVEHLLSDGYCCEDCDGSLSQYKHIKYESKYASYNSSILDKANDYFNEYYKYISFKEFNIKYGNT